MYLYVAFFNEDIVSKKRCFFSTQYLEPIKAIFPNYRLLCPEEIEGCIAFFKGKENKDKNCLSLNIKDFKTDTESITLEFEVEKELDIKSELIDKALYKLARQSNWVNDEIKYYPLLCVVEKNDFDSVRKGTVNARKVSSYSARIDEFKAKSNWKGLCDMYEPLETIREKEEIWANESELYDLAFACSKLGEPQNGLERDRCHLQKIKRYRDFSIDFYKRCHEIKPTNFRYASAVGYRHYQNISELTKPKGRRDGKVSDELSDAIEWLDRALEVNPNSIKDNYRKGRLILERQIDTYKKSQKDWTRETYLEISKIEELGIRCLEKVIEDYEKLTIEKQINYYRGEYVKALYFLGCFYIEQPRNIWNDYVCFKMLGKEFDQSISGDDINYIGKAKDYFIKCFQAETNLSLEDDLDFNLLVNCVKEWSQSPMDKMYRLGHVYLEMFFAMNLLKHKDAAKTKMFGSKCEKYLISARQIGDELKRKRISGRNTWFINEKLAHYYIISDDYEAAMRLLEGSRDSYIKNTYAVACMLSAAPERFNKAELALISAADDNYSKVRDFSYTLLAYLYTLSDNKEKMNQLISNKKASLNTAANKLFLLLEKNEDS